MTDLSIFTDSQRRAYKTIMESGKNCFLCGNAGTGKSFLLEKIIQDLKETNKNVVVCAPTGIAALNIGGTTVHRLFELKPDVYVSKKPRVPSVLTETDVLIIDEISFMRCDLFEYVGQCIQKVRRHIQVIVCGDFCQLPPVIQQRADGKDEKAILDAHFGFDIGGGYCFLAPQWTRLNFQIEMLTEVVRQDDDVFILALDLARKGDIRSLRYFRKYASPEPVPGAIYIAGRNAEVNRRNTEKLAEIEGESKVYEASADGDVSKEDMRVAPETLELKVGARVMTLVNDENGTFYNGSLGTVTKLGRASVMVQIDDGEEVKIKKYKWEIYRYEVNGTDFARVKVGEYKQLPLKLAWAVTVHKSQGQTFAKVDLDPNCWDSGQLYVALSRVKSIEGLHITKYLADRYLKLDPAVKEFYDKALNDPPADTGYARDTLKSRSRRPAPPSLDPRFEQMSLF